MIKILKEKIKSNKCILYFSWNKEKDCPSYQYLGKIKQCPFFNSKECKLNFPQRILIHKEFYTEKDLLLKARIKIEEQKTLLEYCPYHHVKTKYEV